MAVKLKRQKKQKKNKLRIFNDYKDCLLKNEILLKSQQIFKSERHDVYTEDVNKVELISNDDKRLQTFDRITPSAGKGCESMKNSVAK